MMIFWWCKSSSRDKNFSIRYARVSSWFDATFSTTKSTSISSSHCCVHDFPLLASLNGLFMSRDKDLSTTWTRWMKQLRSSTYLWHFFSAVDQSIEWNNHPPFGSATMNLFCFMNSRKRKLTNDKHRQCSPFLSTSSSRKWTRHDQCILWMKREKKKLLNWNELSSLSTVRPGKQFIKLSKYVLFLARRERKARCWSNRTGNFQLIYIYILEVLNCWKL